MAPQEADEVSSAAPALQRKAEVEVDALFSMTLPPALVLGACPKMISEPAYLAITPPPGLESILPSCDDWNGEPLELTCEPRISGICCDDATRGSQPGSNSEVFASKVECFGTLAALPKTAVSGDSDAPLDVIRRGRKKRCGRGRGGRGAGSSRGVCINGNIAAVQPNTGLGKAGGAGVSSVRNALRARGETVLAEVTNSQLRPAPSQMPIPRWCGPPAVLFA